LTVRLSVGLRREASLGDDLGLGKGFNLLSLKLVLSFSWVVFICLIFLGLQAQADEC
jgi:hypothetical protein